MRIPKQISWWKGERERNVIENESTESTFSIISSLVSVLSLSFMQWQMDAHNYFKRFGVERRVYNHTLDYRHAAWDCYTSDYGSQSKYDMHFDVRMLPFQIHRLNACFKHHSLYLSISFFLFLFFFLVIRFEWKKIVLRSIPTKTSLIIDDGCLFPR